MYYNDDDQDYDTGYLYDKAYADMFSLPLYTADLHVATIEAENMAIFGQSTVRFFNEALGLTVGLRYDSSKRTLYKDHTLGGVSTVDPINGLEKTNSELLPKLALDYRINKNVMSYASYARGYKAGGFAFAVDDPSLAEFDPEIADSFEIGIKTELPELGIRINLTGFYTMIDDYQDRVQLDYTTVIQANAAEADIYGFEFEGSYALTRYLSLNAFFGSTFAEYGEYIDPMTGANYENNQIANIPEYDSGLFLEYRNNFGIYARAEMQNIGGLYYDSANTEKQDAYTLYNAKIGYERENWDIYLSIKNITNEEYFMSAYEDSSLGWLVGKHWKPENCMPYF